MERKSLTKPYRLLYKDELIINKDYLVAQIGYTYPAKNILSAEFDTKEGIEAFVVENKLSN